MPANRCTCYGHAHIRRDLSTAVRWSGLCPNPASGITNPVGPRWNRIVMHGQPFTEPLLEKPITQAGSVSQTDPAFPLPTMKTIYVTVERGLVQDVTSIPAGIEAVGIDYDVDLKEADRLDVSPLDGEPCEITTNQKEEWENPA